MTRCIEVGRGAQPTSCGTHWCYRQKRRR